MTVMRRTTPSKPLQDAYRRCASLQRRHDPTFHVATRVLPADVRPAVHALYGFLRGADEIVDAPGPQRTPQQRREALDAWQQALEDGVARGGTDHPLLAALVDAAPRHGLPLEELRTYMDSMRIDCDGRVRLRSRDELDRYMNGSAAAVGRLMAPLIGVPQERREDVARLGVAFQLTNFLRDVREDYEMDRVYLPDLDEEALASGAPAIVPAGEVHRARELFGAARAVTESCTPRARPGIRIACAVYLRVLRRLDHSGAVA